MYFEGYGAEKEAMRQYANRPLIAVAALIFAGGITSDGERVISEADGTVALDAGDFEEFPLPDYAAKYLADGYTARSAATRRRPRAALPSPAADPQRTGKRSPVRPHAE